MKKIQLGGIKILEGQSRIESSCDYANDGLARMCHQLGVERINLSLLTHIADDGHGKSATTLCTESASGFAAYFLVKLDASSVVDVLHNVCILSSFPHDRRPLIAGALFELLARERIYPIALASSPSAISVLTPSADTKSVIDGLFRSFEFPDYRSPIEWHAAYLGKEQMFRDVVGSYEEQDIKVYAILDQTGLDLWTFRLNSMWMGQMGTALRELDGLGLKMPFFVAHWYQDRGLIISLCLAASHREDIRRVIVERLPYAASSHRDAAAVFLHGPHFGDRHGIASELTGSLHEAGIKPLAVSCTVHSISVVLKPEDLRPGVHAISTRFHVPGKKADQAISH
jgi:aspartokinase